MIELILSFTASIAIGYLLSRMSAFPVLRRLTDISTTIVIYLLLFLLGAQTGSNEEVLSNLAAIGLDALLLALAGTVGSAFAAWLLYRYHRDFSLKAVESSTDNRNRSFSFGTLCSLVALILGVISGKSGIAAPLLDLKLDLAMVLLYILLISVGLGIGLKLGLGAMALLSNIFRELIALIFTPLLAKKLGPYAAVAAAGTTSMDVCLPGITRSCGPEIIPATLISGVLTDFSVPFLVSFFCSL